LFELFDPLTKRGDLIFRFVVGVRRRQFGSLPASRDPVIFATIIMDTLGNALVARQVGVAFELLLTTSYAGRGEAMDVGELKLLFGHKLVDWSLHGRW